MESTMNDHTEDDFIDMEVSSFSNFFRSPQDQREFEFHMSSNSLEKQTTSPADELFYQGKLLPLHLPPRLQMVEKLLEQSNPTYDCGMDTFEDVYGTPLMTTTTTTPTATSTPFESCSISPTDSCFVSRELNLEEYVLECSAEDSCFISQHSKKSWTKKLKLIKQSSFDSKLKASRACLRSWLGKSVGSADSSCKGAAKVADEGTVSKAKESLNNYIKAAKKAPFGQIQKDRHEMVTTRTPKVIKQKISEPSSCHPHRRSFSMSIKRNLTSKSLLSSSLSLLCSSSSKSNISNGNHGMPFLKRSSSLNSEIENPIQGAIAHCKQSQQLFISGKNATEVGCCT